MGEKTTTITGLVADIGGANARFAFAEVAPEGGVRLGVPKTLPAKAACTSPAE